MTSDLNIEKIPIPVPWWVGEALADTTEQREFYIPKGIGSGGTYGLVMWHYLKCLQNRDCRYSWCIAPTYSELELTLIPMWFEVLHDCFHMEENRDFVFRRGSRFALMFRWGQVIQFLSAHRPERLVGASISHATGTECAFFTQTVFERIGQRCRAKRAVSIQQMFEGVPETDDDAYAERANFRCEIDEANNRRRFQLRTKDNPFLPDGYFERLWDNLEYDPVKREMYLFGVFRKIGHSSAYWNFTDRRNVLDNMEVFENLPIALSYDWQASPLSWVASQNHKADVFGKYHGVVYVAVGESSGTARGVEDSIAEFEKQFPLAKFKYTNIEIDGGADGYNASHLSPVSAFMRVKDALKSKGYQSVRIIAGHKAPMIKDRLGIVNKLLHERRVLFAPWLKNVISSYSKTKLKPGTWELVKVRNKDTTHYSDAHDYHLVNAFGQGEFASKRMRRHGTIA